MLVAEIIVGGLNWAGNEPYEWLEEAYRIEMLRQRCPPPEVTILFERTGQSWCDVASAVRLEQSVAG
jgi:hypothetical protein